MELTLLDPKDGATSFCVRLPPELELPKRAQDYVIGVTGRLDINCCGPTIEVFLQGTSFDYSTARCRNRIGREACLEKLMTEIEPMKIRTLAMPLRQIGLVTGANTRAEYDVCDRLNRGRFGIGVKTFDVRLRKAASIAEGIDLATNDKSIDAIVIARGGGAPYDLHHFNQPVVLKAIAAAVRRKFVLTAIGHAQDETLADQLASHCEPVPTAAATYINSRAFEYQKRPREALVKPALTHRPTSPSRQ